MSFVAGAFAFAAPLAALAGSLSIESGFNAVSAEIITFDIATDSLLATADAGVEVIDFSNPAALTQKFLVDFTGVFSEGVTVANVTSVAADPLGRGFAAASIYSDHDTTERGVVALFDTSTGAILNVFEVGFHPDCVAFSDDGAYVVTADEGEWSDTGVQTPGSVSVIAIGAGTAKADLASLSRTAAFSCDFSAANLADGVSTTGLRVSDPAGEGMPGGLEPEYVSCVGGVVYASLQEASAIAVLDIATRKYTDIIRMPAMERTFDASDKDGGIHIDDSAVMSLPMPDTIKAFVSGGRVYIATANEGDFGPEDGDKARIKDLGKNGLPAIDATYLAELNALYGGNALADAALGRLSVSTIDGLGSDGEIEQLYVPGGRSFSIIDAQSGEVVWDSGAQFETMTASLDAAGWQDGRSDDKGPEPEGITVFEHNGRRYAAIVMERTYGMFLYDITNPQTPFFSDYVRSAAADEEPESVLFVSEAASPDGEPRLVVSYEASCTINVIGIESAWAGFDRPIGQGPLNTGDWMGPVWLFDGWVYSYGLPAWLYMPEDWVSQDGAWAYLLR